MFDPEEVETRIIHDLVDFNGKDVLEIGCGDGRLTWRYADSAASVVAFDPDEEAIESALEDTPDGLQSRVELRVADITTIDLPEAAFDVAILSWSI